MNKKPSPRGQGSVCPVGQFDYVCLREEPMVSTIVTTSTYIQSPVQLENVCISVYMSHQELSSPPTSDLT